MKPLHISQGRAKIPLKSFNRNPVRFVPFFNEMNFNFVYNWNLLFLRRDEERTTTGMRAVRERHQSKEKDDETGGGPVNERIDTRGFL